MPRNNPPTTNGNGQKPTTTVGRDLEEVLNAATTPPQHGEFQLNTDATIGSLLTASDESYAILIAKFKRTRAIKIKQRAREVANILNPYLQEQEIMIEAKRIVEEETAGLPATGHSLPTLGLLSGY